MNADSPASKPSRAVSSLEVERFGRRGRGVGEPAHHRQRFFGRLLFEVDRFRAGEDFGAGALDQRVDPDREALVAFGLDLDRAGFLQLFGLFDHLVPGRRRLRDQVFAVPEQLGVGVERRRVELASRRWRSRSRWGRRSSSTCFFSFPFQGSIQPALANSPVRITSRPMMSIEGSFGAEPADQLFARLAGVVGQQFGLDRVAAVRFLRAACGGLFDRPAGLDRDEEGEVGRPIRSRRRRR